jgi:hypothetical protein
MRLPGMPFDQAPLSLLLFIFLAIRAFKDDGKGLRQAPSGGGVRPRPRRSGS